MPLSSFERLHQMLASHEGEADFSATFSVDAEGRAVVDLEVRAVLTLQCQASLDIFELPVKRKSLLAVVADIWEQEELPEYYEATCTEDGRLIFKSLVEDELLLAVPQVARKPGLKTVCFGSAEEQDAPPPENTHKPFATLQSMMKQSSVESDTENS